MQRSPFRLSPTADYNQSMQFRLRTLLIVLALGPPLLAVAWYIMPGLTHRKSGVFLSASILVAIVVLAYSVLATKSHVATLAFKPPSWHIVALWLCECGGLWG